MQGYMHTLSSGCMARRASVTVTVVKDDRGHTHTQLPGLKMEVNTGEYDFNL